ncbi:DNA polymerase III subunit chi [Simiduia sp. 21SJ11W-1]|uniref:DNA polymerase III subunit chi n=1 Tax=Simiduia sp. 21SJ11W-1 TaxID=2909669 RepID=UPI0020A06644|nr:DNA polymerase III subunit chi [Simiduia sp. 21SJ11W-1]UTA49004.1 DNA polymerase III subunit chi [Simiduia sp. 21SJ11W-1]
MTKVDFLASQETDLEARLRLACRVAQKAIRSESPVFIACQSQSQLAELDALLWNFEPESFLAHTNLAEGAEQDAPITLGTAENCGDHHGVLINLCAQVPPYFSRFERLFELVVQVPEILECTRANWSYYKSRGYPLDFKTL